MSTHTAQLDAGGLLPANAKVDPDATEQIVARTYRHPALGERPVVRLASGRLGQAEDLAMEFLGFESPAVSQPIAVQQRRSLSFAAWALINDPGNAHYALDLVKQMKAAARKARSKPGHAWDAFVAMAKELGRSARHFLPPYWEEVGRTFKDLGNQTYAGRALNKSLEAERVHALPSDRARRRDVVLEFVLAGCLAGKALSDYASDLSAQYPADEAFTIFRDLCVRRTFGGMAPWAAMAGDFVKMAEAAGRDGDRELEAWLEQVIDAPAMGRAANQFWKSCSKHCRRIVARNPAFAVALLRHTRPEERYYGESKLWPWLDLLDEWGVFEYLWEDEHQGAPPLGEPIAIWFGRVVRDELPVSKRGLDMLEKLTPRLKREKTPLPLSVKGRYRANSIDIDLLEACLTLGIPVADPPNEVTVTFFGWLTAEPDHPYRNQDIVESGKDDRFKLAVLAALNEALGCRGGTVNRGWRQTAWEQRAFPLAAADRPGIKQLWHEHTAGIIAKLEGSGLARFEEAKARLEATLWPDTLRLFPDLAARLGAVDPAAVLRQTLQVGVLDEYGMPALEQAVDQAKLELKVGRWGTDSNISLTFPDIVVTDKVHAHVIRGGGTIEQHELRLPKHSELEAIIVVGDDLAVVYRDQKWAWHFHWASDPSQSYACERGVRDDRSRKATVLADGGVFLGRQIVHRGDKQPPESAGYWHDGQRFWRVSHEYEADQTGGQWKWKVQEVDPQTGKTLRESVPAWFEETEGGEIQCGLSELMPAPAGAESSPLGVRDGLLGWKTVKRRDGSYFGEGLDGRRWDRPLLDESGAPMPPVGLLRQPGTDNYLPVSTRGEDRTGAYWIWDPTGSTTVAALQDLQHEYAGGQVTVLPIHFWHLLKPRHEASSQRLRSITDAQCQELLQAAAADRDEPRGHRTGKKGDDAALSPLTRLLPAVKKILPQAPERMAVGIARVIERAEREGTAFVALRDKAIGESQQESSRSSLVVNQKIEQAAAVWGLEELQLYGEKKKEASVSAHLAQAAAFLKGDSKGGDLPRTSYLWFAMLDDLPLRCWQTFWRVAAQRMAQKEHGEIPWLEFLEFWRELAIAELPGQFAVLDAHPEGAKQQPWGGYAVEVDTGVSFTMQQGDDLFIAVEHGGYGRSPYQFLRYSIGKTPGNPPGYKVTHVRKLNNICNPEQVTAFLEKARLCEALPLPNKEELQQAAANLSVSPAEIGLIWLGGLNMDSYGNNFLPAELRNALGCKLSDVNAGRQALQNLKADVLAQLFQSVVGPGLAAPFADDRGPVLRSIEKTWRSKMPKRLPLDAAMQKRLSALSRTSYWHRVDHEQLLAVAADPAKHPLLQPREIEIRLEKSQHRTELSLAAKKKNEPVVSLGLLRSIVQLVGMVHAETPAGHEARAGMPHLIKQTTRLLNDPKVLLDLWSFGLYEFGRKSPPKPTEWINQHLGRTKANAKDGSVRFDDGLIAAAALDSSKQVVIGVRPAKLKDQSDVTRLRGILAIDIGTDYGAGDRGTISLVAAIKSPGFQKLATAILAKDLADGQWPQNPSHTASAVVAGIQKKCKLGEDAAMLYAQLLALPDPTTANVRAWNNWTAVQLKNAAAELVKRELVLEAQRARAGRTIFLPGEWSELKAPWLPIETWKLAHLVELDLDAGELTPAGGPMVLRPFEDLFAAAWQRILDGDEPRYEEVKRRARKK